MKDRFRKAEGPSSTRSGLRATWRQGVISLVAVVVLGFGLSACEAGASSPGIASVGSTSTTTSEPQNPTAPSNPTNMYDAELRYSQCMRASGVPDFPEPNAGGGFRFGAGLDPASAEFQAARAKCQKFLPAGGQGSGPPPTAQALAQMLKVAQCMRRHGISDFPDPRSSLPPVRPGIGDIADRDGVILVFPPGFDETSPEFTRAAAACGFQLTNH